MQIKYLLDYPKTDSINGCGLRWEAGQVRNVSPEMAERLLVYVDTWASIDDVDVTQGADNKEEKDVDTTSTQTEEIGLSTKKTVAEEPLPVIDFHAMDKKALVEFAETKYNEKMDKRWSETTIRHHVIALFGQHEMDEG